MNPGLNPAMSVELGRRALHALMTPADKVELLIRSAEPLSVARWLFPLENYALASDP